jgi:hypothetical protein
MVVREPHAVDDGGVGVEVHLATQVAPPKEADAGGDPARKEAPSRSVKR